MAHIANKVRLLAAQGLTDEQIAEQCDCRISYITKILKRRPLRGRPLEIETAIEWAERIARDAPSTYAKFLAYELLDQLRKDRESKSKQAGGSNEAGRGVESKQGGG